MINNNKNIFNDLFVFDLANNHQGDLNHAIKIIDQFSSIAKKKKIKAAIKFQFRNLKTFIHPNYKNNKELKHINRFESTELKEPDYEKLVNRIKERHLYWT